MSSNVQQTSSNEQQQKPFVANWGIVSTGLISEDFAKAVKSWQSNNHQIVAVSARDVESAKEFAEKFQIPNYYDSYEKLFADKNVNVVYIGSVNQTHRDLCLKAIEAGKHVLCEKPMTINRAEQEDVLKAAEKKNVFFMEGIWTRFFPVVNMVKQDIEEKKIGELKYLISNMMIPNKDMVRVRSKEYGGGSILDLGIYPIQMACLMFDHEKPIKINATGHLMKTGVDECCSITLLYPNQRIAQLNISSSCHLFAPSFLVGDKGVIEIPEFSECPTQYVRADGEKVVRELPNIGETNFPNTVGLRFEAEEVRQAIEKGLTQHPLATHDHSRLILSIMEEAKNQIGYKS